METEGGHAQETLGLVFLETGVCRLMCDLHSQELQDPELVKPFSRAQPGAVGEWQPAGIRIRARKHLNKEREGNKGTPLNPAWVKEH